MLIDVANIVRMLWIIGVDQKTFNIIDSIARYVPVRNRYNTMANGEVMIRVAVSKLGTPFPMVGLSQTYAH